MFLEWSFIHEVSQRCWNCLLESGMEIGKTAILSSSYSSSIVNVPVINSQALPAMRINLLRTTFEPLDIAKALFYIAAKFTCSKIRYSVTAPCFYLIYYSSMNSIGVSSPPSYRHTLTSKSSVVALDSYLVNIEDC